MFWSDWGTVPNIAKAGMDGSDPHLFIKDGLQWPTGLALDYGNKRLYWLDAKYHFIESINLDGSDRRVL
jgi:Low-density lipoprotein receptor repeat class B